MKKEETLVERARGYLQRGVEAEPGDYTWKDLVNYCWPFVKALIIPMYTIDHTIKKVGVDYNKEYSKEDKIVMKFMEPAKAVYYGLLVGSLLQKF